MDSAIERCHQEMDQARAYILNGGNDFGALMAIGDWGVEMAILDGKYRVSMAPHKHCACGVNLYQSQDETDEAYKARVKCPRCEERDAIQKPKTEMGEKDEPVDE